MSVTNLELQIKVLPNAPGVYQYFDKDDKILYVGKAKNLKKRVASYFNKVHDSAKTNVLVKKIVAIKHIVVETETDALLLENNLIKSYQPRYNILLKDDKTYPWICIKKERFPRVFSTRKLIKDGSLYYGPYPNTKTVYALLDLIRDLFDLRSCSYDLSKENVDSGKYKVCLEYHIKNCKGACEGYESEEEYMAKIDAVKAILKGNFKTSLAHLQKRMQIYASRLEFEMAQQVKLKIEALQNYQSKSTIVSPKISNVDVFSIVSDESYAYVNFLQLSLGSIVRSHTMEVKKKMDEKDEDILPLIITEIRQRFVSNSTEILVPFNIDIGENLKVVVPKLGDKKKVLDLSLRNAKYFRIDKLKQAKIVDPDRHTNRLMATMKSDLRLSHEPRHIECFDNSNIQGSHPVAACVVFKDGKPSKKDYRHFNIKTVEGPDDFASMEEVVFRRYKRLLAEGKSLPQLIVIDGGKGQLSSALKSIDVLGLRGKIAIVGIAKRLEELYYPGDSAPLYLNKKSETLKVIQYLRNEAHRFGIEHHRNKRSKSATESDLNNIEGIGEQTLVKLIKEFKSVTRIKKLGLDELTNIVGKSKANKIWSYYNSK